MENENDIYAYNFTLKIIFVISFTLVILDCIQIFLIFDAIIKGYNKFPIEVFNECIKYQKIGDLFFSFFGVFTGMSVSFLSFGLLSNMETFRDKFFDIFVYYNYIIFGPYLLSICFLSFYYFKDIAFTCNPNNFKQRFVNLSTVICILFSLSFSLMITIVGSVAYSVKTVIESISSDRDGNYLIGRIFWGYIFSRHFNNNNNGNNNNNNGNNNGNNGNNNGNNGNNNIVFALNPLILNDEL